MKKKSFFYKIFLCFLWTTTTLSFGFKKVLDFPLEKNTLFSIEPSIMNLLIQKSNLLLLPSQKNFSVVTPKNLGLKTREERFGKLTDMQRKKIANTTKSTLFTAGLPYEDQSLLLDGKNLEIYWLDKDHKLISKRSIIWDLIRPPLDGGQEAANWLVKKLRVRFALHYKKSSIKLVGMIPHKEDSQDKGLTFLASTQIPGYPFVTLSCDKNIPNNCQINRACSLDGPDLDATSLWGLSIETKKEKIPTLLVLDQKKHKLLLFHYFSCLHIAKFKEISLPQRLYTPSGLFIDENSNLWITTLKPDDYLNASVYMWESSQWQ